MKQKVILLVGGGLLQLPQARIAKELGLYTIVTDQNPGCAVAQAGLADDFCRISTYDVAWHVEFANELRNRYGRRFVGVFTSGADVAVTVAQAASSVGLPSVDPRAAYATQHKPTLRKRFDEAGVPGPQWAEVWNLEQSIKATDDIGYPLIVKNTDNAASRGCTILRNHDEDELNVAMMRAIKASHSQSALIEGLMTAKYPGLEHTVETLMDGMEQYECFITDRTFLPNDRWAVEKGIQVPSQLSEDQQRQMYWMAFRGALAAGIDFGAAKVDMMWTPKGPRIIEMAARLSGGCECQWLDPYASGRRVIECAMRQAIGQGIDERLLQPQWDRAAVAHSIMPKPGRIVSIEGVDVARECPFIEHVFLRHKVGDNVPEYHDCASRSGWIIAKGATTDQAWANATYAAGYIKIVTEGE